MIRAVATKVDGSKLLVLGITKENVERLKQGRPIHVEGAPMGVDTSVVIYYGETARDLIKQLKDAGIELPAVPIVGIPKAPT